MPERLEVTPDKSDSLAPTDAFPALSAGELRHLKEEGWFTVGIVAAIFNERGEILALEHEGSAKNADGALGLLAETSKLRFPTGDAANPEIIVEQPLETFQRGLSEELGIIDPFDLHFYFQPGAPWAAYQWPVGVEYPNEFAYAICPIAFLKDGKDLEPRIVSGDEIQLVRFMPVTEIMQEPNVRPGTHGLVQTVMDALTPSNGDQLSYLELPQSRFTDENSVDARLEQLDL